MPTRSITLDTGALMALERGDARMRKVVRAARGRVTVPAAVLPEWWRNNPRQRRILEEDVLIEPMTKQLGMLAGEAIAEVSRATPIDAVVMASAAQRGDLVYTSDIDDLSLLQSYFRGVTLFRA